MISRRWAIVCLLLLLPATTGQDFRTIGGNLTKAEIEELRKQIAAGQVAQDRLKASEPIKLDVGTFFPFRFGQANQLWLWDDESICSRVDVAAKTPFALWGMVVGDKEKVATLHQYPAKDEAWGFLIGVKEGTTRITVISNGEGGGPPVILDRIVVIVGKPKPPPPPPDADPLVKLALADIAANKGTLDDLDFYRSYLLTVANSLPATIKYATSKDFWTAYRDGVETTIKDRLPSMRKAIGEQLNKDVPEKEGDAFDAARRSQVATVLKSIAARLEVK